MPFHIAAELQPDEPFFFTASERIAAGIIFGTFEGGRWDFENMCWIKER
jgi:hypothetical protein